MFHLYSRRSSTGTYTTNSSFTTTTITDEGEIDVLSLYSISFQIDITEQDDNSYYDDYNGVNSDVNEIENDEEESSTWKIILIWFLNYLKKFASGHEMRPKRIAWHEYIWSFVGSFLGILIVALMHYRLLIPHNLMFLIGSFGASAVLIYGAPQSPLAQPRNVIGGHFFSAVVGCTCRVAFDRFEHSVTVALAVAISIVVMQFTETVHPPGGATALIAVTTQPELPWANFLYIFMPILTGAVVMLIVALLVNNLSNYRTYPSWWW
ncbi:unnamed protein product [Adineta ricciae]|uniref:HPP transmembrane region domain-containing protein n=1 Tax=Adineta ricciae TaxID=249248 RepID=A0A814XMA8_ADIRI|nr:unnamed protein product [Adineta ricciae]CAF1461343.1 unnamed protein product [Adineta ricciae]